MKVKQTHITWVMGTGMGSLRLTEASNVGSLVASMVRFFRKHGGVVDPITC